MCIEHPIKSFAPGNLADCSMLDTWRWWGGLFLLKGVPPRTATATPSRNFVNFGQYRTVFAFQAETGVMSCREHGAGLRRWRNVRPTTPPEAFGWYEKLGGFAPHSPEYGTGQGRGTSRSQAPVSQTPCRVYLYPGAPPDQQRGYGYGHRLFVLRPGLHGQYILLRRPGWRLRFSAT